MVLVTAVMKYTDLFFNNMLASLSFGMVRSTNESSSFLYYNILNTALLCRIAVLKSLVEIQMMVFYFILGCSLKN